MVGIPLRYCLYAIASGLCGCASVAKKDLAHRSDPIPLESFVHTALNHPLFAEGQWPSSRWWEALNDPQLTELIELALAESPTLKKAEAQIAWGIQLTRKQRSTLLPHLSLDFQEEWQHFSQNGFVRSFYPPSPDMVVPANINQLDLLLNFNYEFDFWGKNRKKLEAALGVVQTRLAEKAEAELVLTTYLTQVYIELQAELTQKTLLERTRYDCTHRQSLSHERIQSGIDSLFSHLRIQQQLYLIDQLLAIKEKEIALHRHLIGVLTGLGPERGQEIEWTCQMEWLPASMPLPTDLSAHLIARRPDLQAQIGRMESASKEIGVAKREFYPNVNLCAFAGLESLAFNDFFNGHSLLGGLLPTLHLPLFTGGYLTANLKSKVATYNEMVFTYNEQVLHAAQEVADQLVILQKKHAEVQWQTEVVKASFAEYRLEGLCFQEGIRNRLSVLEKEEAFLSEQLLLIERQKECGIAGIALIKALGGGYVE